MVRDLTAASGLATGQKLLDFGCAQRPYEHLMPSGTEYIGADLAGNPRADLHLTDAGLVPLPNSCIDVVLSTQVLEHVAEPGPYLRECARLLRPGGSLILSTHGIMYYHQDPEDYWRWTSVGLAHAVEASGLQVVEQRGVLGLAAAGLQLFQEATRWRVPVVLRPAYVLAMQTAIRLADARQSDAARIMNGLVIAVRAVRPPVDAPPREAR